MSTSRPRRPFRSSWPPTIDPSCCLHRLGHATESPGLGADRGRRRLNRRHLTAADPRIRIVNRTPCCGEQAGPSNHGVERARGRYVASLNHGAAVMYRFIARRQAANGSPTEIFRDDGQPGDVARHVSQRLLPPGAVSAWHAHAATVDRLFCGYGTVRLRLYDGLARIRRRTAAPTFSHGPGTAEFITSTPGVWHAVVKYRGGRPPSRQCRQPALRSFPARPLAHGPGTRRNTRGALEIRAVPALT